MIAGDRPLRRIRAPIALWGVLLAAVAAFWLGAARGQEGPKPAGDWRAAYLRQEAVDYPAENPYSDAKAALGAVLFFDPILSGSHGSSCATCHQPALAWADNLSHSAGDRGQAMLLRSPTLLDVAGSIRLGWDGKFPSIEAVTFRAISADANMDLGTQEAVDRLSANPAYTRRFEAAFGPGPVTARKIELALATYERGIVAGPAPFDDWVAGNEAAVSDQVKRGFALFTGKAGCVGCHSGPAFTDHSFQDIGSASGSDIGRGALFPTSVALRYAFKVPTLRDVAVRAPYMHDGSLPTLADVVDLYDRGGIPRPSRSSQIRPLGLSGDEKHDLVAFLESLTSHTKPDALPLPPH